MPTVSEIPSDFSMYEYTDGEPIFRPKGCRNCRGTGYSGRLGIYELLETNDKIRQMASEKASTIALRRAALAGGMISLREDGWMKVAQGLTSIDEVLRVTKADKSGNEASR